MRDLGGGRNGLATAIAVIALTCGFAGMDGAQARHRVHHGHHARHAHHVASQGYTPPYAAMVVDANTGRVLHAVNENAPRHPASITKVMTLYLLFEQLEKGRMTLDSEIPISAHAASMAPTKLGLRPGSTISVEHAIKAIVTKSANDIAVAVGEAIGGTEEHFAELMTAKAHSLGMNGTHYENASGLPDAEQITTAHDLVLLGRAIQERFPRYYAYFSTHQFTFAGQTLRNHNHLLDKIEGMDGIKTGYTNASGFNLLSSVKRGNKRIVGVVLGGHGLFTWGATAKSCYETTLRIIQKAADWLGVTAAEVRDLDLVYVAPEEEKAARRRDPRTRVPRGRSWTRRGRTTIEGIGDALQTV